MSGVYLPLSHPQLPRSPCWVGLSKGVPFAPHPWAEKQLGKSTSVSQITHRVMETGFQLAMPPGPHGTPGRSCVLTSFKGKQ